MIIPILLISGLAGSVLAGLGRYALSVFADRPLPVSGTDAMTILGLGFVAGIVTPFWWSLLGVGYGNSYYAVVCRERERWCHTIFIAAVLGILLGVAVFAAENPRVSPLSLVVVPYLLVFIIVAEGVMILGRGFNWILGSVRG